MQKNSHRLSLCSTLMAIGLFCGIFYGVLSGCFEKSKQTKAAYENETEKAVIEELPQIGEIVTTERGLKLCEHYGFNFLAERIEDNPDQFKEWEFDGCSMTPTDVVSDLIKVPSLKEICLRHDLGYAYGDPGNEEERIIVDKKFQNELRDGGAIEFVAKSMFNAVRVGGKEKLCLPFSWGFARVASCKRGVGLILKP